MEQTLPKAMSSHMKYKEMTGTASTDFLRRSCAWSTFIAKLERYGQDEEDAPLCLALVRPHLGTGPAWSPVLDSPVRWCKPRGSTEVVGARAGTGEERPRWLCHQERRQGGGPLCPVTTCDMREMEPGSWWKRHRLQGEKPPLDIGKKFFLLRVVKRQ